MNQATADECQQATGKPTAPPVLADNIPAELRSRPQWVVWRYVEDVDPETGEVDWDKPPLNPTTGNLASSTNRKTWCSFDQAWRAYQGGNYDGMGFALDEKKRDAVGLVIVAIDLDKCRDPETGSIEPWALDIVRNLNSYTEISPSGRGIRIFLYGFLPKYGRKKGSYENYQASRYVTVTGQHLESTPLTLERRQDELLWVHHSVFGDGKAKDSVLPNGVASSTSLDDAEIVRQAGRMKNSSGEKFRKLWTGDIDSYKSRSEADAALCNYLAFWCGPDQDCIAELFAQSGLFRSKWQREDYRQRTIALALNGRTEFFDWSRTRRPRASSGRVQANSAPHPPAEEEDEATVNLTDVGNGKRLMKWSGADLRHWHPWKKWLVWHGARWQDDATAEATRCAKNTVADLARWAADQVVEISKRLKGLANGDS
jgi:primase-polymerase (primpol)-like protein